MSADWVEMGKKRDTAAIDTFMRDCNTRYNYYDNLYKKHYSSLTLDGDTVVEVYAGCMPHYLAVLKMKKLNGSTYWKYGNITKETLKDLY